MYAKSFDMNNVIRNTPRFIINKIIIIIFNCFKTMDNAPGTSSTRSTVDAPDDYIVKIYNSKKEQVGSYTYAEIKTTGNIELPQDSYTVTAESPNYASTPDVAWETPVYYGEISVNVIKKLTTTVNNLVCKWFNSVD